MSAGTNEDSKKVTYWSDGTPNVDLQSTGTDLSKVTFWVDGMLYITIYPASANTGAMMQLIWGVE